MKSYYVLANDSIAFKSVIFLKVSGENTLFVLRALKLKSTHPVNYFPGFLGKNIKNFPPRNYSYLPPCLKETLEYVTGNDSFCNTLYY